MIVRRRKTQSRIVRHRTTVIRSSYDHSATLIYKTILASHHAIIVKSYVIVRLSYDYRTTIVRLSYDYRTTIVRLSYDYRTTIVRLSYDVMRFTYDLASHQATIAKSYAIVRLSLDCRTMSYDVVRCRTMSYDVVRCRTMSYDVVRCRTVSYDVVRCRTMLYTRHINLTI